MKLTIEWQRLVDGGGETCDRCGGTENELDEAVLLLKRSLQGLGIHVELVKKTMAAGSSENIIDSNRMLIQGRPLEEWLGAEIGTSACEFCCSELGEPVECRTTTLGDRMYEVIPSGLIVKAGLKAASEIMEVPREPSRCAPKTCSSGEGGTCCC